MYTAKIKNIQGLISYVAENSAWQTDTIHHVITALGYRSTGGLESLKNLSANLADCAKHGADGGFPGFT
jgi:ABC-type enterochelin transport system substrate-binding protein